MKKYYILWILLSLILIIWYVLISKQQNSDSFTINGYTNHEVTTNLTTEEATDFNSIENINKEYKRLKDQFILTGKEESTFNPPSDIIKVRKNPDRANKYQEAYKKYGDKLIDFFFTHYIDYTIRESSQTGIYNLYESMYGKDKLLFSHPMTMGSESVIDSFDMLYIINPRRNNDSMSQPVISFYDTLLTGYSWAHRNIWIDNYTTNERYNTVDSALPFAYNNKLWYVWGSINGKQFIIYDGQKISNEYDYIQSFTCCTIHTYPIRVQSNWILIVFAIKWDHYIFIEISLNKK